MTLRSHFTHALTAAVALVGLSACYPQTAQWTGTETMKRNTVDLVRLSHDIAFDPSATALSAAEKARLDAFLGTIDFGYGDRLALDLGAGEDGVIPPASDARGAAVRAYLAAQGYELAAQPVDYGPLPATGAVRLVVERYVVTPPPCPDWRQPAYPNYANAPSSNFGCSTATALGMMVADPRDLVDPADLEPSEAEKATKAIQRLRADQVKWGSDKGKGGGMTGAIGQ